MLGTYALSSGYYDAYYLKAQRVRTLLTRDFEQAFEKVDAIVTPTAPTPAFKLGEKSDDPLSMYLADIYTVTADLAGVPGISVPCGKTQSGLPIGLQVLGRHFDESTVLRVAAAVERPYPQRPEATQRIPTLTKSHSETSYSANLRFSFLCGLRSLAVRAFPCFLRVLSVKNLTASLNSGLS